MKPFNWKEIKSEKENVRTVYSATFKNFPYSYEIHDRGEKGVKYKILREDYYSEKLVFSDVCRTLENAKTFCENYHWNILRHVA